MINRLYKKINEMHAITLSVLLCLLLALPAFASDIPARGYFIIEDNPVPLGPAQVLTPVASGKNAETGGGATLDYSNSSEGYVMAKASGGKFKIQITKQGGRTYTYDLNGNGNYETYPLTGGNGKYNIGIFKNVSGNQYAQALVTNIDVKLKSANLPFLYPNQFVNFNKNSKAVAKGVEVASGSSSQIDTVTRIYNFVITNLSYDTAKATSVQPGYVPNVDAVLAARKGICFDYAALMATMLRTQGIPTRLEVGYVSGGAYHAWISVFLNGVGWVNDVIYFDGKSWSLMDPTFASSGGGAAAARFIGDGKNYSVQYLY